MMKIIPNLLSVVILLTSCSQRTAPPAPVSYGYQEQSVAPASQAEAVAASPLPEAPPQPVIEQSSIQREEIPVMEETSSQAYNQAPQKKGRSFEELQPHGISEENDDAPPRKPRRKKPSAAEREKELEDQFSSLEETPPLADSSKPKKEASAKKTPASKQKELEEAEKNNQDSSEKESPSLHKKETSPSRDEEVETPKKTSVTFSWPVKGEVISHFSQSKGKMKNDGINIAVPKNTPVVAIEEGVVVYEGNEMQGFGNLVLLKHPAGWMSAYGHCSKIFVKRGQKVQKGARIALVGDTGSVRSPQLHFQLRKKSTVVDPLQYLE